MGFLQTHAFIFNVGIGLTFKNADFMLTHYILHKVVPSFLHFQRPNFISKHLTLDLIFCRSRLIFLRSIFPSIQILPQTTEQYISFRTIQTSNRFWVSLSVLDWNCSPQGHQPPCANSSDILSAQFSNDTMGKRLLGILAGFFNFRLLYENPGLVAFSPLLL